MQAFQFEDPRYNHAAIFYDLGRGYISVHELLEMVFGPNYNSEKSKLKRIIQQRLLELKHPDLFFLGKSTRQRHKFPAGGWRECITFAQAERLCSLLQFQSEMRQFILEGFYDRLCKVLSAPEGHSFEIHVLQQRGWQVFGLEWFCYQLLVYREHLKDWFSWEIDVGTTFDCSAFADTVIQNNPQYCMCNIEKNVKDNLLKAFGRKKVKNGKKLSSGKRTCVVLTNKFSFEELQTVLSRVAQQLRDEGNDTDITQDMDIVAAISGCFIPPRAKVTRSYEEEEDVYCATTYNNNNKRQKRQTK